MIIKKSNKVMKDTVKFQKISLDSIELAPQFRNILFDKGSMTAILEKIFDNIEIKILKQEKIFDEDNSFYIYREIIIHNNIFNIMHAVSYIKSDFFRLIDMSPDNFLENEFLGKLIFDESTNLLNYGLTRSNFECGLIDNQITRVSEFYKSQKSLVRLYESFLPEFFLRNSKVA